MKYNVPEIIARAYVRNQKWMLKKKRNKSPGDTFFVRWYVEKNSKCVELQNKNKNNHKHEYDTERREKCTWSRVLYAAHTNRSLAWLAWCCLARLRYTFIPKKIRTQANIYWNYNKHKNRKKYKGYQRLTHTILSLIEHFFHLMTVVQLL